MSADYFVTERTLSCLISALEASQGCDRRIRRVSPGAMDFSKRASECFVLKSVEIKTSWWNGLLKRGLNAMKNVFLIALSIFIVWIAWQIIGHLIAGVLGLLFQVAMIALLCFAVYTVYKMLNREKIV